MGDGIQKNYAVIVNGDTNTQSLENVDAAVRVLHRAHGFDVSLESPAAPKRHVDRYVRATSDGLRAILDGLKSKTDDDDRLVLYVTGHPNVDSYGHECLALEHDCYSFDKLAAELSLIPYGKRVVIFDSGFEGFTSLGRRRFFIAGDGVLFADDRTATLSSVKPDDVLFRQAVKGSISSKAVRQFLLDLNDPDDLVRMEAALDLGHMKATAAIPALIERLHNEENPSVKGALEKALADMKNN